MHLFKRIIPLCLIIMFLVSFPGCGDKEPKLVKDGKARVNIVLKNLLDTREDELESEQLAICMWFSGHRNPYGMTTTLRAAESLFGKWKKEGGFQVIKSYTIDDAWVDDEADHPTALVEGTINGRLFLVSVPQNTMIAWEEVPNL